MYSTGGIYIFSLICKRLRLYLHKVRGKRGLNMFFGLLLCTRIMDLGILRFPREGSQCRPIFFVSEKDSKWMIAKFKKKDFIPMEIWELKDTFQLGEVLFQFYFFPTANSSKRKSPTLTVPKNNDHHHRITVSQLRPFVRDPTIRSSFDTQKEHAVIATVKRSVERARFLHQERSIWIRTHAMMQTT